MIDTAIQYAYNHVAVPSGRVLWLYAVPSITGADVYTPLHDQARVFEQKGLKVFTDVQAVGQEYDAIFIRCPKQYEETQGLMALALDRSRGFVMALARNDAGGGRLRSLMQQFDVSVEHLSKSRSKIVWTTTSRTANRAVIEQNLSHLAPRSVTLDNKEWQSVPGLFGWNQIDPGSKLLMQHLPSDLSGVGADFGCGYGYISSVLAEHYPAITQIDAYDVDTRATACCRRNNGDKVNAIWQDIQSLNVGRRYDFIIMNPPFHSGKAESLELGKIFIQKAFQSLKSNGRLFMVANKHLAYEQTVPGIMRVYEGEGYKILTVRVP